MSTSFLPRRSGARSGAVGLAALAVTGIALFAAPGAVAAPGDNGDVTPRVQGVAVAPQNGQPAVCRFQLEATGFDTVQGLDWTIEPQPAKPGGSALSGSLSLVKGAGKSEPLTAPEGAYRLTWKMLGGAGAGKQKDFKAECSDSRQSAASPSAASPGAASPGAASPGTARPGAVSPSAVSPGVVSPSAATPSAARPRATVSNAAGPQAAIGPNGGPPAGGGGLAQDFSTVAGAAAVGSAAIGGAMYLRMRRRRADGAA
ncbi:hypothetical protein [Streptomyces poonensis]|nr:hypothetical protein [Streptomyces poonensis]GLJ88628.1 hypothetical protein GCM10017589_12280 [Streptomyces poonensis]